MNEEGKKLSPFLFSLLILVSVLALAGTVLLIIYQVKIRTTSIELASHKTQFTERGESFFVEKFAETQFVKGGKAYPGGIDGLTIKLAEEEQDLFSMSREGVKLISVGLENTLLDRQLTVLVNIKEAFLSNKDDLNFWLSTLVFQALYSREQTAGLEGPEAISAEAEQSVLIFKEEHGRYPLELTELKP